jgi:GWxTD domain-containing protein
MPTSDPRYRTSRKALLCAALLVVALLPSSAPGAARGSGDFEFYTDAVTFRGRPGRTRLVLFVQIPNSEVRFKKSKGKWTGRVQMEVRIDDDKGNELVKDAKEFQFYEADEDRTNTSLAYQMITANYNLPPGEYKISCRLKDLNSPKLSLVGAIKNRTSSSQVVDLAVTVPSYEGEAVTLSDAEFLAGMEKVGPRADYEPNPTRLYGLYRDTLLVYYELYAPRGAAPMSFKAVALDQNGDLAAQTEQAVSGPGVPAQGVDSLVTFQVVVKMDLSAFPAGRYTLYAEYGPKGRPMIRIRSGAFDVAWEMRTWEASRRNLLAEARFLMDNESFKDFKNKSRAEQERELKKLWRSLDPDPATGTNEAYEEFLARLDYVNANYSDYQLGIFTDRGLIYMRYGRPSEIIRDVLPMNRESTSDAIAKVKDKYRPVIFSTHGGRPVFNRPGSDIVVDKRRVGKVGEGGNVAYPYELWIYEGRGDPILPRDKGLSPEIGLRFLFIDRDGYGRYKLEVSSSLLEGN